MGSSQISINPSIALEKIKVSLANGRILFWIESLKFQPGVPVLIRGESGAGKTTLLHLIAGLFLPTEGSVRIGETQLETLDEDQRCEFRRKNIGVIFQKLNLIDHLTVEENTSLALEAGSPRSQVQKAIDRVNLKGKEQERSSYLSLGEQQRVAVARVLAQQPQIILADEPTSSLDEKNCRFVLDSLLEASLGKMLIVVSHDHRIHDRFERVINFADFN